MSKAVANLSALLFAALLMVVSVGRVLPRGEQMLFSSSNNWQATTWSIYMLDLGRGLAQRLLDSRTDTLPGLPVVWSPDGQQIAYLSGGDRLQTYLVDSVGKNPRRLSGDMTDNQYNAEWSPDGRSLAFIGEYQDERAVYLADADGGEPRRLTSGQPEFKSLVWSPDSQRLALESMSANQDIYLLDITSGALLNLSNAPGSDIRPAWSPDGTQIGYLSSRGNDQFGNTRFDLYLADTDGGNLRRLTNHYPADSAWTINWSPGGERIAFGSLSWSGGTDIYVVDVTHNLVRNVTRDTTRDANPAWSPDGQSLAFESRRGGRWELHLISADGWHRAQLTNGLGESRRPAWSPDGQSLFYISNPSRNWDLYMLNLPSRVTKRVTRTRSIDFSPLWRP